MPFPPSRVEELFQVAAKEGRLAHAHLLTGAPPSELESLGRGLAANLLDADLEGHPDFYSATRIEIPTGFDRPSPPVGTLPLPQTSPSPSQSRFDPRGGTDVPPSR